MRADDRPPDAQADDRVPGAQSAAPAAGPSAVRAWARLVVSALAEGYLVLLGSLAVIAVVPIFFGWHTAVVMSGSMEPRISTGDVVASSPFVRGEPVPVGGVVTFSSPAAAQPDGVARTILHRVVAANDDGTYVTAGDANADVDSTPLRPEQIIGQARLLVPFVGLPSLWIARGQVLPLLLWGLVTAAAVATAVRFLRPAHGQARGSQRRPGSEAPAAGTQHETGRRAALVLLPTAALLLAGREPLTAAFSSRTGTRSAWRVAHWLTPGRAGPYALLTRTRIDDTVRGQPSTVAGGVALAGTGTLPSFWGANVTGPIERGTAVATAAVNDARALYDAARAGQARNLSAVLLGRLTPGIYATSLPLVVAGRLTLDALGDPRAVFVLRARSIIVSDGVSVVLAGGARAANVHWVAETDVNLAATSTAVGTFLAGGNATMQRQSVLDGRLVALAGVITLTRATLRLP